MSECVFCEIIQRKKPAEIIYEDEKVLVFKDINPQSPIHYLIIPKKHIEGIQSIKEEDIEIVGYMFYIARKIAESLGINNYENGYRLVFNVGKNAGQSIFHLHLHFLAGRKFIWPPG
ncbi:MAG: histidine triad nucleotide-binding protein [Candidatus Aenigmatarchaeota archaeon]